MQARRPAARDLLPAPCRRSDEAGECELRDLIQRICLKHRFYGYRRVTAALRRQGMVVNAKKVQRLMREDNLLAQRKAPFLKPPADRPSAFLIVPNLVRGLVPSAPDQIWVADITYVHLARAFAYLAVILDAFSRKAVGWALENTLDASLAIAALETALDARKPQPGSLIHHSDRGVQYASIAYRQRLAESRHHDQHEQAGQSLRQRQGRKLHEDAEDRGDQRQGLRRHQTTPVAASMASSQRSTTRTGCTRRSDTNRPLSSKPRSRKTKHDNASWQPHCH